MNLKLINSLLFCLKKLGCGRQIIFLCKIYLFSNIIPNKFTLSYLSWLHFHVLHMCSVVTLKKELTSYPFMSSLMSVLCCLCCTLWRIQSSSNFLNSRENLNWEQFQRYSPSLSNTSVIVHGLSLIGSLIRYRLTPLMW